MLSSNQSQIIEEAKFTYSPLNKALEKQTEKQVDALKLLNLSNKRDALIIKKNFGYIFKKGDEWFDYLWIKKKNSFTRNY